MPRKTASKRRIQEGATPVPPGPVPTPTPTVPLYVTTAYLEAMGITDSAQLQDAGAVYTHLQGNPWIARADLVIWATELWGPDGSVDRLNAALGALQTLGLIAAMS